MQSCLICDDHALMREALAGVIRMSWPEVIITMAADFDAAFRAMETRPDLCLCDLSMPGADPLAGIKTLRSIAADTPVLIITASEDDALLVDLFRQGIAGFIPKTSPSNLIEAAIRVALAGGQYVPPRILDIVSRETTTHGASTNGRDNPLRQGSTGRLTERQIAVLRLVAKGHSNKEIAKELALSPATVKAHIATILGVIGATNRTEAVMIAEREGQL